MVHPVLAVAPVRYGRERHRAGHAVRTLRGKVQRYKVLVVVGVDPADTYVFYGSGERIYEEATGDLRKELDLMLSDFEAVLNKQEKGAIEQARNDLKLTLDEIEAAMQEGLLD